MKKNTKAFTIVELVIVIAVIAILAGVLIPTFSGIVKKAKENAALQEAKNEYTNVYAMAISSNGVIDEDDDFDANGNKVTTGSVITTAKVNDTYTITTAKYIFTFNADGILKGVEETATTDEFTYTVDQTKGVITGATKAN